MNFKKLLTVKYNQQVNLCKTTPADIRQILKF
jgi:hypothetical protein